jgi:hypothetical protein
LELEAISFPPWFWYSILIQFQGPILCIQTQRKEREGKGMLQRTDDTCHTYHDLARSDSRKVADIWLLPLGRCLSPPV